MRKIILSAIVVYLIVCAIGALLPSSDEAYNVLSWKLLMAQIYAIPAFLIVFIIGAIVRRKAK